MNSRRNNQAGNNRPRRSSSASNRARFHQTVPYPQRQQHQNQHQHQQEQQQQQSPFSFTFGSAPLSDTTNRMAAPPVATGTSPVNNNNNHNDDEANEAIITETGSRSNFTEEEPESNKPTKNKGHKGWWSTLAHDSKFQRVIAEWNCCGCTNEFSECCKVEGADFEGDVVGW